MLGQNNFENKIPPLPVEKKPTIISPLATKIGAVPMYFKVSDYNILHALVNRLKGFSIHS